MDYVQNCDSYTNIPLSQDYRSYIFICDVLGLNVEPRPPQ
jgi:hypothetical protein